MDNNICEEVRGWLSHGEDVRPQHVSRHLAACVDCRREAARVEHLLRLLAEDAEAEPSARLDRTVRAMLLEQAAQRPFSRAGMAAGLAVAALLSMLAALSTVLAEAGAAEKGPVVALILVMIYLALSSAAAVPLLLSKRWRQLARAGGFRA